MYKTWIYMQLKSSTKFSSFRFCIVSKINNGFKYHSKYNFKNSKLWWIWRNLGSDSIFYALGYGSFKNLETRIRNCWKKRKRNIISKFRKETGNVIMKFEMQDKCMHTAPSIVFIFPIFRNLCRFSTIFGSGIRNFLRFRFIF